MFLLPQELMNEVIYILRNDKSTLNSLSLVNRTIARECQRYLFSRIVVRGPNKPLHDFGGSAAALKQLLQSSPHLARHVRCLELFDTMRYRRRASTSRGDDSTVKRWLPKDRYIAGCISNFTNLEAFIVQFHMNDFPLGSTEVPQGLVRCCQNVLRRLQHVSFMCISDVPDLSFLEEGLNLKHLWICEGFYEPAQTSQTSVNPPIYLQSLCLEQKSSYGIPYHYFLDPSCRFSIVMLRKLAINVASSSRAGRHYVQIAKLLDLCASTLEELEFVPSVFTLASVTNGETSAINLETFHGCPYYSNHLPLSIRISRNWCYPSLSG
ncbi:hypothetical protein CPB83DRAFT_508988 [Crepidotus variabilis]|uniref:Uncharacterized protein n=1 Tax=Crepidotus variabilis TaxID=179855 RepID=A0A9P6EBM9_9AGAR|nr:hypothetical protein CPB83DRAFT_508988 [Crepidotus variabilis]